MTLLRLPTDTLARVALQHAPPRFTIADDAPQTWAELQRRTLADGRLTVWSGASEGTIYGSPAGNYAFRAWHDSLHLARGLDFSPASDYAIADVHAKCMPDKDSAMAVYADVAGQTAYYARWGEFPVNQQAFVLAFVQNQARALERRW